MKLSQPLTQSEREILEAAGCGWVLERINRRIINLEGDRASKQDTISGLQRRVRELEDFIRATAEDEGHLSQEARAILHSPY